MFVLYPPYLLTAQRLVSWLRHAAVPKPARHDNESAIVWRRSTEQVLWRRLFF